MSKVTEYILTETFSLQQIKDTMYAQQAMYNEGLQNKDIDGLISALGSFSTVLGLVFTAPTPAAVGGAIAALISTLGSNDLPNLKDIVEDGYWDLGSVEHWMEQNEQYDIIKLRIGFLDYKDEGIRFVQHTGTQYIDEVHSIDGGWHTSNR